MRKIILLLILLPTLTLFNAQSNWTFIESTNLQDGNGNSTISGTISGGYIFKTISGKYYIAEPLSVQIVVAILPSAKIYQKESFFKLIIEDFGEPVICKKLENVIKTQISGEFKGWEGETIFKLMNGQIWKQATYSYLYHYSYSPDVLIYKLNGSWTMRVADVDETINVIKLN
jgi:hypothetical protein